ncbi:MAG TPA: tetratricopeptide repeat protein [Bryobacteraceae bacterium]|nr:tetratricopeptide repeat protein [Bryobacteraceae bacterium]
MRNRLLVLGAALAAFGASLFAGFHFDDYGIFSDARFTEGWNWKALWASGQPLTDLTFRLNYWMGGRDPFSYHLFSLLVAVACALLAYECLRLALGERAALAGALVFTLHPIQAEAVNYIWARAELLGAAFCLLALAAWWRGWRWAAVPAFAAGLLANEYAAALPVALLLLPEPAGEPGAGKDSKRPARVFHYVPTAAMWALGAGAIARLVYLARVSHGLTAPGKYFLAEGPALWRYLRLLAIPYGFSVDPDVRVPALWLGAPAWAGILAAAVWAWRRRDLGWPRWLPAGLALLLPVSSALPRENFYADHRMYLPMLAFAAAAGLLLAKVRTPALTASVAIVLGLLCVTRTVVWMNDKWLWQEAVQRAPNKARPKVQLSRNLPAVAALEMLERAQVQAPRDPSVPAEMGKVLLQERQVDPALIEFGQALALDPNNAEYYNDRGVALVMSGWNDRARDDFERALEIDPNLSEATENLKKLPQAP